MKNYNLLERFNCIWCILTQKDYIVLTATMKGNKRVKSAAYISNAIPGIMIRASISLLEIENKFTNKNK